MAKNKRRITKKQQREINDIFSKNKLGVKVVSGGHNFYKLSYFDKCCLYRFQDMFRMLRAFRDKELNYVIKRVILHAPVGNNNPNNRKNSLFKRDDIKLLELLKANIDEEIRRIRISEKEKRTKRRHKTN